MRIVDISVQSISSPPWNPNEMTEDMKARLRQSLKRFGLLLPLIVRRVGDSNYETVGGAQRLAILREMGASKAPCIVVDLVDSQARLLSQALNHICGSDNAGLRGSVIRSILESLPMDQVMAVLPDTATGLEGLASMDQETVATCLRNWEQAQKAKLKHMQFHLTPAQVEVVEEAFSVLLPVAKENLGDNPNVRGMILFMLCRSYLDRTEAR